MMRDEARLEQMRSTLAVDGYHLSVEEGDSGFDVRITADPESCADCLVPKKVMVSMLEPILGVPAEDIRLAYPSDAL
ncbi:hypothetical protein AB0K60_05080 [Thermopolyspora sp. NPDC052614]|uniref:hypothetical protein n=1 Tax=Thermopolyspora sp. NPDC052614 TaxID=3155682 RepID=UPI003442E58B